MRPPQFMKWLARLPALNVPQRLYTLAALDPAAGLDQVVALIDQVGAAIRRCPGCACERYHRHGQANGLQRYRCRQCRRTYNDLSGTPLARLRLREKWLDYLGCVLESKSVRASASQVGVHRNTAFRWRHRFLDVVGRLTEDELGLPSNCHVSQSESSIAIDDSAKENAVDRKQPTASVNNAT